jgi:excisionase family DNA binding protein
MPIRPQRASRGWRGRGLEERAPHPVPPLVEQGQRGPALLVDSREVARLLGVGRTKAFELMARDELPVVRIGRCVRVSRAALEAWIAEQASLRDVDPDSRTRGRLR